MWKSSRGIPWQATAWAHIVYTVHIKGSCCYEWGIFSHRSWCLLIFTVDASTDLFQRERDEVTGQLLGIAQLHTQMESRPSLRPSLRWPRRRDCTVTHPFFCGWCCSNTWWISHQGAGAGLEHGRKKVKSEKEKRKRDVCKRRSWDGWIDG